MKKFVADFETVVPEANEELRTRIWGYGLCEIGNEDHFKYGTKMDDFMEWCKEENRVVFFHNLKFDASFILFHLLTNGYKYSEKKEDKTFNTLISDTGQFYSIEVIFKKMKKKHKKVIFQDSLKKLPYPVKTIAEAFKLPILKGEIDYKAERKEDHVLTNEEIAYIKNDVQIVAKALHIQFSQGLQRMTVGSDALNNFKEVLGKHIFNYNFPVLPVKIDLDIRSAYKGGFTYVADRFKGKDVGEGLVYDVNSLYPSVMYNKDLPYGQPIYFKGKYEDDKNYPLYIQRIFCEFTLKPNKIPMIQIKNNLSYKETEYLKTNGEEAVSLTLTNVDLKLFFEHYDVTILEYEGGWKFRKCQGIFKEYIDYWSEIKINNDGALKNLAKLMLNSLYGKFSTHPIVKSKYPVLEDDKLKFKKRDPEERDPVYCAMGAFITSWARDITIRTAQSVYHRFAYADTDSIHILGTDPPDIDIDDKRIGAWKCEGAFSRARFVRQKTYIEEIDGVLHVTCSGMPDKVKSKVTWENFKQGFTEDGKLVPKQVHGGVVLVDTYFTIK